MKDRHPKGVPYWAFDGDARAWRRHKRKQWRAVLKALDEFRMGSVFSPVLEMESGRFDAAVREITRKLSPAEWGV